MPTVDLRETTNRVICPDPGSARGRHMTRLMGELGLPFAFERGPFADDPESRLAPRADLKINFCKALFENRARLPLLLMEDDCAATPDFRPRVELPEADVAYLGVSHWGVIPEVMNKGILGTVLARDLGGGWVRVYNMLQLHAVLFLTERGIQAGLTAGLDGLFSGLIHDVTFARRQRQMRTVATVRPFFYQSDALQAPDRRAFLKQEAASRVVLDPAEMPDAVEIHLDGARHRFERRLDRAGDPHWRPVDRIAADRERPLRVRVHVGPGGRGIRCRSF